MFDFNKIASLIPPQGNISFTITAGRNAHLVVLVQPIYPAIDTLNGQKKEDYQQARVPMVLEGTPDELNNDFMRMLEETGTAEGMLQRAFLAKQEAIKKAISTTEKTPDRAKDKSITKEKEQAETKATPTTKAESKDFSLFQ